MSAAESVGSVRPSELRSCALAVLFGPTTVLRHQITSASIRDGNAQQGLAHASGGSSSFSTPVPNSVTTPVPLTAPNRPSCALPALTLSASSGWLASAFERASLRAEDFSKSNRARSAILRRAAEVTSRICAVPRLCH